MATEHTQSYETTDESIVSEDKKKKAKDVMTVGGLAGAGALIGGPVGLAGTGAGTALGGASEYLRRRGKDESYRSHELSYGVGETFDQDLFDERLEEEFDGDREAMREEYENLSKAGVREMTASEKAKATGERTLPWIGAGAAVDAFGDEAYDFATNYGTEIMETAASASPEVAGAGAAAFLGGVAAFEGMDWVREKLRE